MYFQLKNKMRLLLLSNNKKGGSAHVSEKFNAAELLVRLFRLMLDARHSL